MSGFEIEMVGFEELYPGIVDHVPGADEKQMNYHLKEAYRRLVRKTGVLKETFCLDSQECVSDYRLEDSECFKIHAIQCVRTIHNDCCYENDPGCCNDNTNCRPSFKYENCWLHMYPAPGCDMDDDIEVTVSLTVRKADCGMTADFCDEYGDIIVSGALDRMLRMPQWRDIDGARNFARQFKDGIGEIRNDMFTGGGTGPSRLKEPSWARSGMCGSKY